ncbi:MAG: hypothetical protein CHACPFDD_03692 [Phycisphaerae bacterium]|nr:hypothetical protein [Phycisphaerae bacterium]
MTRTVVGLLAILALSLAGCEKNAEPTMASNPDPGASLDNLDRRNGGLAANDATLPVTTMPPAESKPPTETVTRGRTADDTTAGGDEVLTPTRSKSGRAARGERQPPRTRTYVVKKGDSLSKIAKKVYGDADRWTEIWNANKGRIKDKNKLTVGQKLTIP